MTILVTGSAGHLGEALMRTLPQVGHEALGVDVKAGSFTHEVGSITDRGFVKRCIRGARAVLHTATLHKPHIGTHSREQFVATIPDGASLMIGGFMAVGTPERIVDEIVRQRKSTSP